eukprot:TRINITY_DN3265_c0_g2_i1.p1 TRINITY_DN3265_c0_g2~~TRINITY_DN3265_c0_g2_i1.p1  ORF type:complete len:454 (-),score=133.39 TRINITY_DN3265_c0_g2_i1:81-1442(-)
MEYCAAGSCADIMKVLKRGFTEPQIAALCTGVLRGLSYLHDMRRIHRDVKAGNILLNNMADPKLADFGVSGKLTDTMSRMNTVIGTPYWMAPEVIQNNVGYTTEIDIWSLGITLIELAQCAPPHGDIHPMRAIFLIPTLPPPTLDPTAEWSPEFRALVARCLRKQPSERASAKDLLVDPFLQKSGGQACLAAAVAEQAAVVQREGREHALGLDAKKEKDEEEAEAETETDDAAGANSNDDKDNGDEEEQHEEEAELQRTTGPLAGFPVHAPPPPEEGSSSPSPEASPQLQPVQRASDSCVDVEAQLADLRRQCEAAEAELAALERENNAGRAELVEQQRLLKDKQEQRHRLKEQQEQHQREEAEQERRRLEVEAGTMQRECKELRTRAFWATAFALKLHLISAEVRFRNVSNAVLWDLAQREEHGGGYFNDEAFIAGALLGQYSGVGSASATV